MDEILQKIENADWESIAWNMDQNGFAIVPNLLNDSECQSLIANYDSKGIYRKTVVMERYRFGLGEYKYFDYPLPDLIQQIRTGLYPKLAPIANRWFKALNLEMRFPFSHNDLLDLCRKNKQMQATALILKYGSGGFNTLHQDLYGEVYFPMQVVIMLNEPDVDYTGGEFVLVQQIPRAQSKASVLNPKKGDALIFTTNFKPEKGTRGYYRMNMKHGVSEVISGRRHSLGIIFHDATS